LYFSEKVDKPQIIAQGKVAIQKGQLLATKKNVRTKLSI